ncbi:hypothetical protein U9M48_039161 [Paspalum notatum var. saurae]|uniref:RRM domain-containing protein n=1 Tax=Paspalum notatum var. saurae TaxID=547442 RepID=A0AAQ3UN14_PASNO
MSPFNDKRRRRAGDSSVSRSLRAAAPPSQTADGASAASRVLSPAPATAGSLSPQMSQAKEVRYTARSITPPADRNGISSSPPPKRRSPSRSPPPRSTSRSPRPRSPKRRSNSRSPPRRRGRSRSRSEDDRNPGNNLYVTGLSTRVTEEDLEKFFSKEGKVKHCHVVLDPRSKESRGFAFVTMDTVEDARRCIKYLHRTVLEGRLVTVEKFNMVLGCLNVNLVGTSCAVFDHGCRQGMCSCHDGAYHHTLRPHHRLLSTPPSPTLHTCYINTRAAAIERSWSLRKLMHLSVIHFRLKELEKGLLLLENTADEEAFCFFILVYQRISKKPITLPLSQKGAISLKGPQKRAVTLKGPKGAVALKGPKGTVSLKGSPEGAVSLKGPPEGAVSLEGPPEGALSL